MNGSRRPTKTSDRVAAMATTRTGLRIGLQTVPLQAGSDMQTPGAGLATVQAAVFRAAGAGVDQFTVAAAVVPRSSQRLRDLAPGAAAAVGQAGRVQTLQRLRIQRAPIGLAQRRRVRMQAAVGELTQDRVLGAGDAARAVDILDAHQLAPAMCARVQPRGQRRDHRAGMQPAGRRRRKAADIGQTGARAHRISPACCSSSARRVISLPSCSSHQPSARPRPGASRQT